MALCRKKVRVILRGGAAVVAMLAFVYVASFLMVCEIIDNRPDSVIFRYPSAKRVYAQSEKAHRELSAIRELHANGTPKKMDLKKLLTGISIVESWHFEYVYGEDWQFSAQSNKRPSWFRVFYYAERGYLWMMR